MASSFSLTVSDKWLANSEPVGIKAGDKCHIDVGKRTILDGYVDEVSLTLGSDSRSLSVSGRSNALDLIDCSYDGQAEFKNTSMEKIVEKLFANFSAAKFRFDAPGGNFAKITIRQGETIAEVVDRMARQKKLIVYPDFDGTVVLSQKGSRRSPTNLIQGVNILSAGVSHSQVDRFSEYKIKGQTSGTFGTSENATKNTGLAFDAGIERKRPFIMVSENSVNAAGAKARAEFEASKRAAKGSQFNFSVQGWFDENGELWDVNKLIGVQSQFLGHEGSLLINSITYTKSSGGTITSLKLVRPDSYEFTNTVKKEDDLSRVFGV